MNHVTFLFLLYQEPTNRLYNTNDFTLSLIPTASILTGTGKGMEKSERS
uniref:Uncharacterized protein n=1 Tax=Arundo donax TaxID=35708 RepID=A0A0A9DAV8_ARUDO